MKKILYLSTCDTCKRIMRQTGTDEFMLQDIKTLPVDERILDLLKDHHGSYAALVNKRAIKWRKLGTASETLSELEVKALLLEEYTFLKRPVYIIGNKTFIGNSPKTVEDIISHLNE